MSIDYMGDWRRSHYSTDINPSLEGHKVIIMGWVKEIRDLGGIRFILIRDQKGTLQITVPERVINKETLLRSTKLHRQDCIAIKGTVKTIDKAPRGVEIIPQSIKILAIAKQPLPLDITERTPAEIDVRLDARVLDLRSERNFAIFKIKHNILMATRKYLSDKGFLEVNTPKIIASSTEGGAALFPIVYFEQEAFLAQSPQLYKEELIIDFEKVYEIGPAYRAEKSNTRRHITEFVSIDIEQAFATAKDVMKITEELMKYLFTFIGKECKRELIVLNYKIDIPKIPFKRFSYEEIISEINSSCYKKESRTHKLGYNEDIPTPYLRNFGAKHPYFYFITDWPSEIKPFYIKPQDDNPQFSEGFDLMWNWIELASGGTRVHEKHNLERRLKEKGLNPETFKSHLQAFDFGMPPHAGWAIGLERLVMILTGIKNIREAVLYPRDRFRLTP